MHDHTSSARDRWQAGASLRIEAERALSLPHKHLCLGSAAVAEKRLAAADIAAGGRERSSELVEFPDGFSLLPHRVRALEPTDRPFVDWRTAEPAAD